jgi:NAD(P)-dependent dehydrogenase (short-subunit alcohol dehydrogenase family)
VTAERCTEAQATETDNTSDFEARAAMVITFLESVREDRAQLAALGEEQCARLLLAAGQVARPDPWAKRELLRAAQRRRKEEKRARDEAVLSRTGIREKRREQVFITPPALPAAQTAADIDRAFAEQAGEPARNDALPEGERRVIEPRACYVCKCRYHELHPFYDSMCGACGDFNWQKRTQSADLRGRVALITGARVKIGYQGAIMLLRAGAHVVVTTRFPRDAAARYAREEDFAEWGHRLEVHGLDLRHTPSVEAFASHMRQAHQRLDFIINNACQTVRRPAGFYTHLMAGEQQSYAELPAPAQRLLEPYEHARASQGLVARGRVHAPSTQAVGLHDPAALSQLALVPEDLERSAQIFPTGQLDADLQQVDLRGRNSWRLPLAEVSTVELLEVQLVNAVAPFVLCARLKPLMLKNATGDRHIVNVSAMEGQFYRTFKTDKHPHTNMAKAALNMLTRTSAADYVKDGIHMNSVDTGWVTDEDAAEIAARKTREQGFHPPLDIVDGAARICDPIFSGITTGKHAWGVFFKDYAPTHW